MSRKEKSEQKARAKAAKIADEQAKGNEDSTHDALLQPKNDLFAAFRGGVWSQ